MSSVDNPEVKKSIRRSKVKNLEEEVELIFSQDESDDDVTPNNNENILPKTPSRQTNAKEVTTPRAAQNVLHEIQTPRRSCRKSIKPTQDYDDIVNKSLRSCTRSAKKHLLITEEEVDENEENQEGEVAQPKWTPAKVGRVSQKRSRKSKRNGKGKKREQTKDQDEKTKNQEEESNVDNENEIKGVITEVAFKQMINKDVQMEEININQVEVKAESNTEKNDIKIEIKDIEEIKEISIPQKGKIDSVIKDDEILEEEDEPLHLMQEDTEDCKQFAENPKDEDICIVYESNISSNKINVNNDENNGNDSRQQNIENEKLEDSFGCYLKSKEINISDLGLNLLKDEEEEKDVVEVVEDQVNSTSQDTEEMPSLIVCDDDDDDEVLIEEKSNNKLNETFEANDSDNIDDLEAQKAYKQSDEVMETLQMSDDDSETPRKRACIVSSDTELQEQKILSTPTRTDIKAKLPSTPKPMSTPKLTTPKQSAKAFRFPTPYRNRNHFKFNNEVKENNSIKTPSKNLSNTSMISVTTLEPKEIVLRGIRKRSLSVCIDGNEQKRQKFLAGPLAKVKQDRMVSFYSPANQTTIIDDLDIKIAKSLKKQKPQDIKDSKFVTTRRKRSMSFDDSIMSTSHISKLPRPVVTQNVVNKQQTSSTTSKPLSRTKLPNFAAIHEKQFKKMENLVDHISRKQERSKNLINSATKLRPVSAQKNISINKNINNIATEKPKALKKIDLGATANTHMNKSLLNNTTSSSALNRTLEQSSIKSVNNLPDPRLGTAKPITPGTISRRQPQQQQINKYLKPSQTANIEKPQLNATKTKPNFNLSTSLMVKPTSSTSNFGPKANTSCMSNEDKMASRLQRHMDLFKGRVPSTRAGVASRKNEVILKGVRSNRRFELQMQHRKNMEQ